MALASTTANLIPAGEDAIVRRIQALERAQAETLPAVMAAIAPMFADINTALDQVAAVVAALPVPVSTSATTSGWAATNGGVIATISIPWESGKSRCDVSVDTQCFYSALDTVPLSDRPAFRIQIAGVQSHPMALIPDNMDTYWVTGSFASSVTSAASSVTVNLVTATGTSLSPAYAENTAYLGALAIFS